MEAYEDEDGDEDDDENGDKRSYQTRGPELEQGDTLNVKQSSSSKCMLG